MFETSVLFNNLVQTDVPQDKNGWWQWTKVKPWLVPLLILSGVGCVAVGTWLYFKTPVTHQAGDQVLLDLGAPATTILYIDVSGAVENPGVYQVEDGGRVTTAIEAAGGLSHLADVDYLNSTLNLSARLKDEQKIYVPFVGEMEKDQLPAGFGSQQLVHTSQDSDSLISINSASETELDTLPRIGAVTAQKIIDGRPYSSVEDLVTKKVIAQSVLTEIRTLIKL